MQHCHLSQITLALVFIIFFAVLTLLVAESLFALFMSRCSFLWSWSPAAWLSLQILNMLTSLLKANSSVQFGAFLATSTTENVQRSV